MNAARRRDLALVALKLRALATSLDEIKSDLQPVLEEEQEAFDNLPESLQDGDRGQAMQGALDTMQEILDDLDNLDPDKLADDLETAAE